MITMKTVKLLFAGAAAAAVLAGCASTEDKDASNESTASLSAPRSIESLGLSPTEIARVEAKRAKYEARGPKRTDQPAEAAEFFAAQRNPNAVNGENTPGWDYPVARVSELRQSVRQAEAVQLAARGARAAGPGEIQSWEEIGPGNIGGRTRGLVIDPTNTSIMYAAGVAGGVFKTTDGGGSWFPTGDTLINIAVSSLVMDPSDPLTLYAGTGEGFFNGDAVRGLGIFKTTNGGDTWTQLPSTVGPAAFTSGFYYVNKIVVNETNPNIVVAATRSGLWRSVNAGSSWSLVLENPFQIFTGGPASFGSSAGATDLVAQPGNPNIMLAAFGSFTDDGLYRSIDAGVTWTRITDPDIDRFNQGRMTIAFAPSNPNVVYIAMADNGGGSSTGRLVDIFRSTDAGVTWQPRVATSNPTSFSRLLLTNAQFANGCFDNRFFDQGWYDNAIAIDPLDENIVWVGGIDLFRSDDGGQTFGQASYWYLDANSPDYSHADVHTIVFQPNFTPVGFSSRMFVGSDGGISVTSNPRAAVSFDPCPGSFAGVNWAQLNNGYKVTQFYHGDASATLDRFGGGTQDNGTLQVNSTTTPENWDRIVGGDGGYVQYDPTNPNRVYAETQNFPTIRRSDNGGASFSFIGGGITDSDGLFITPFALDKNNPNRFYTGGTRPWFTSNVTDSPNSINWLNGPNWNGPSRISAIAIAPSNSDRVYMGTSDGYVAVTSSGTSATSNADWSFASNGLPTENAFISDVAVDPVNANIAYATTSTFGVNHIYRTTDGGINWFSIDGIGLTGVPDVPVHSIAIRPSNPQQLYAGTEIGVFVSEDGGGTWASANIGQFPLTVVEELVFQDDDTLVAFTHGRSAWIADLGAIATPCNSADLIEPFGVLDLSDVQAFLIGFSSNDPIADLIAPIGTLDLSDVQTFLIDFSAGCP